MVGVINDRCFENRSSQDAVLSVLTVRTPKNVSGTEENSMYNTKIAKNKISTRRSPNQSIVESNQKRSASVLGPTA